jgi:hypothetical protein
MADRHVDGHWGAEDLETLIGLRDSLAARVEVGDPDARLPFQVVVAFIAELEAHGAAALDG